MDIQTHLTLLSQRDLDILNALFRITEGQISDVGQQCHDRYPAIAVYTSLEDLVKWGYVATAPNPSSTLSAFTIKRYRLTDAIKPYLPHYR